MSEFKILSSRYIDNIRPVERHEEPLRDDPDWEPSNRWTWIVVCVSGSLFWSGVVWLVIRFFWGAQP